MSHGSRPQETEAGGAVEVSVVLPTYNERGNLVELVERLSAALAAIDHELIVVDDRSPDGTAELGRRMVADYPRLRVIERQPPAGLTRSIADGVEAARGRFVAWMDCDLSHPPEMIGDLLELVRNDADVAIASRYAPGGGDARDSAFVRTYSRLINVLASRAAGSGMLDYTTGYVLAPRRLVRRLGLRGDYGEYCIDFLGRAVLSGLRIREAPYRMESRRRGESKTVGSIGGFMQKGFSYLGVVAGLAWRRLRRPLRRP